MQDTPSRASSVAGANVAGSYVGNASGKRKFKLPRIEFKLYDGYIKGWFPFGHGFRRFMMILTLTRGTKLNIYARPQ